VSRGPDADGEDGIPAGDFLAWLEEARGSLLDGREVDVPCGDCDGCCRGSYFIHVGRDETAPRSVIPAELLVPAPGSTDSVLGYDGQGRCPMLKDGACSIYESRPMTCRRYDCRVLAAAGILPETPERAVIAERVRRWRFQCPSAEDARALEAVRAAGAYLTRADSPLPDGFVPAHATQVAVLAIRVFDVFLDPDWKTRGEIELAAAVVEAAMRFDEEPDAD